MAASEVNMNIPGDIDVICFGDAKVQKFLSPPLSCVTQPTDLIAQKSLDILFHKIENHEDKTSQSFKIPTELLLRGTCVSKK
jgi:LacI family transcriptional regulator